MLIISKHLAPSRTLGYVKGVTVFSEKLARLPETISKVAARGMGDVSSSLRDGKGRVAVAVGSGGSIVAAEFFARCRATLGLGYTAVMTPMQFVLSTEEWAGTDLWLFSAGADNPDIAAAFHCAIASRADSIHLVTVRRDGSTALAAERHARAQIHALPVADPKDGFLATHSMTAMIAGLLLACDLLGEVPAGAALADAFLDGAKSALGGRGAGTLAIAAFEPGDTIVLLHDPQVAAVAALIETCLWETGIAPVQRTDFRNFAHGRHVWAARHPSTMLVVALTSNESADIWSPIADALPASVRRGEVNFGNAGRLSNAIGIIEGLAIIRSAGEIADIDPGRPGRGTFAEAIYENTALDALSRGLTHAVRHKASAQLLHDPLETSAVSLCTVGCDRLRAMAETSFVGIALDYDGTIVATDARLDPPTQDVLDELVRLVDGGIQIGIATGRGGSAGEMLREVLPKRIHHLITMGYYNGAHIRSLDIDIQHDQPAQDESLLEVADWIDREGLLREGRRVARGKVQLTINHADIVDMETFTRRIPDCSAVAEGRVRVQSSHHSFDIVPSGTSKLAVVRALAERAGRSGAPVLGIGDSGSPLGNDHELLSHPHGVSVDSVCGSHHGGWTLFGSRLTGPAALLRILRATRPGPAGVSIDITALGLDATT